MTPPVEDSSTFEECFGTGFELLKENILDRDWTEIHDTLTWLESETRNICKQLDDTWKRREQAEAKVKQQTKSTPHRKGVLPCQQTKKQR
jgi:hypothetical protein